MSVAQGRENSWNEKRRDKDIFVLCVRYLKGSYKVPQVLTVSLAIQKGSS